MPFTIEDMKARIDVENGHRSLIADFGGFPKEAQSDAIRLLASEEGLEVFGFNVEEEWEEAEMERMELLGHLSERLEVPGPAGVLATFAAREMIAAGQDGDVVDFDATDTMQGRQDLFALALAIADLNSPPPPKAQADGGLNQALIRLGASMFPFPWGGG